MQHGSLTIVGLGPARPEHLTTEALTVLNNALREDVHLYALQHARKMALSLVPDLSIRSLDYLYNLPGVDRPVAYRDLAQMMLRKSFEEGQNIVYLVAGSPLFYNDAVLLIRKMAAKKEFPVRLVHGMSFVDLVLDLFVDILIVLVDDLVVDTFVDPFVNLVVDLFVDLFLIYCRSIC